MKKLYEIMCPPAVVTAGGHMILYSFWAIQPRGAPPYYPVDGVQHMLHAAQPGAGCIPAGRPPLPAGASPTLVSIHISYIYNIFVIYL